LLSTAAPFSDTLESGPGNWSPSGLWNLLDDSERARNSDHAWYYGIPSDFHYDTSVPNSGTLTSKPILIPDDTYQLQFWYHYETEEPGSNWDQRWLQISTNGSTFENIFQLQDDVNNHWLQTKLDLTQYAGQEILVRFYFTTLDSIDNANNEGWLIDDIEIIQDAQPLCDDGNNLPAAAETINFNQTLSREICPSGDIDYYKFDAQAGDHIVLDIDTQSSGSVDNLDLYLILLDGDARSELAHHDDEILGTLLDPHLGYKIKRDGTYYVRARLWSHPSHGGEDFDYQITLTKDNTPPQGGLIQPRSNSFINDSPTIILSANANDADSGVSHVEFIYHSNDWLSSDWQIIGTDQDGTDGWGISLDANDYPEQKGAAFFANIYDWAGNWAGSGAWEIRFDRTSPVTNLLTLNPYQQSTAIQLQWSGTDNISGIEYYQLQFKIDSGDWSNYFPSPSSAKNSLWYVGQTGKDYDFRIRGVDIAGNLESFTENPETSTSIPDPSTICSAPDSWDSTDNDNSPENSTRVDPLAGPTLHNFCNPLTPDRLNDEDWVSFEVETGQAYLMESIPTAGMSASIIELYASDGTTLVASAQSGGLNQNSRIIWNSDRDGIVYLRIRHLDGRIAGNIVTYQLNVIKFLPIFLPFIPH
jgi:hypothetical protein